MFTIFSKPFPERLENLLNDHFEGHSEIPKAVENAIHVLELYKPVADDLFSLAEKFIELAAEGYSPLNVTGALMEVVHVCGYLPNASVHYELKDAMSLLDKFAEKSTAIETLYNLKEALVSTIDQLSYASIHTADAEHLIDKFVETPVLDMSAAINGVYKALGKRPSSDAISISDALYDSSEKQINAKEFYKLVEKALGKVDTSGAQDVSTIINAYVENSDGERDYAQVLDIALATHSYISYGYSVDDITSLMAALYDSSNNEEILSDIARGTLAILNANNHEHGISEIVSLAEAYTEKSVNEERSMSIAESVMKTIYAARKSDNSLGYALDRLEKIYNDTEDLGAIGLAGALVDDLGVKLSGGENKIKGIQFYLSQTEAAMK